MHYRFCYDFLLLFLFLLLLLLFVIVVLIHESYNKVHYDFLLQITRFIMYYVTQNVLSQTIPLLFFSSGPMGLSFGKCLPMGTCRTMTSPTML
jgi:hypothetical protein